MAASVLYRRKHHGRVPSLSVVPPGSSDFTPRPAIRPSPSAPVDRRERPLHNRAPTLFHDSMNVQRALARFDRLDWVTDVNRRLTSVNSQTDGLGTRTVAQRRSANVRARAPLTPTTNVIVSATNP